MIESPADLPVDPIDRFQAVVEATQSGILQEAVVPKTVFGNSNPYYLYAHKEVQAAGLLVNHLIPALKTLGGNRNPKSITEIDRHLIDVDKTVNTPTNSAVLLLADQAKLVNRRLTTIEGQPTETYMLTRNGMEISPTWMHEKSPAAGCLGGIAISATLTGLDLIAYGYKGPVLTGAFALFNFGAGGLITNGISIRPNAAQAHKAYLAHLKEQG